MSKFLNTLTVREIDDEIFQVVGQPFLYQSDVAAQTFVVPVGFYTDFSSVPRWLPLMYSLLGDRAHEPATVHDWAYYSAVVNRAMADKVLLEAMEVEGLPTYQRWLIYAGVRMGGWKAWNVHRRQRADAAGQPMKFHVRKVV